MTKTKAPTVLQIIPALGTGGAEQACADIAQALVAQGHAAFVVSSGGRRVEDIERAGVKHTTRNVATKNPLRIIANAFWLASFVKKNGVHIIHARSRAPAWSAWIASRMAHCHYVTTFHAAYKFSSPVKKFYNRVMARADMIIAISPFIEKHIAKNYGVPVSRICLVNRGVDLSGLDASLVTKERQQKLVREWQIERDRPVILLPARLSPIKNHALMIEAMAVLKRQKKELPLLCFVGDDQGRVEYSDELRKHIHREGLDKNIKLVGACSEMAVALSLASLVVMPSKIPEGFGRVPVEAMAMGVPVLASDLGATQDTVIEGKTGWLLPPKDPVLWAHNIEKALGLSDSERKKMAKTARAHVETHFSSVAMIQKTVAVYETLMKGTHKRIRVSKK